MGNQGGQPRTPVGSVVLKCLCGATFGDAQSYSLHRRYCPVVEKFRQRRQQNIEERQHGRLKLLSAEHREAIRQGQLRYHAKKREGGTA